VRGKTKKGRGKNTRTREEGKAIRSRQYKGRKRRNAKRVEETNGQTEYKGQET